MCATTNAPRAAAPPLLPQMYERGVPNAEAAKQGVQPVVNDAATTALVLEFARSLAGVRPS